MIATVIKKEFGIKLSETSVGRLLIQLGLSCQKPLYRAYQQNKVSVNEWKQSIYPKIQKEQKNLVQKFILSGMAIQLTGQRM